MEDLKNTGLKLFFDEDIFIIKDDGIDSSPVIESKELPAEVPNLPVLEDPIKKGVSLNYKGGNKRNLAIIISNDSNEYLNKTDETLLLNILKALNFSLDDVAIINHHTSGTTWKDDLEFDTAIVFGILPSTYAIVSDNYIIQTATNKKWLFSDSLFALGSDKNLKGKLWNSLQELFK